MKNILFISVVFLIVTTRGLPVQKKEEPSKKEEHQENNVENVVYLVKGFLIFKTI